MFALAFAENSIQLVPDGTLLFHLVLIVLMVALLNATLLKPINRILEERDRRTKGRLSEASTTLQLVGQKLHDYESKLREARAAGYAAMEKERARLSKEREQSIGTVRGEISQWVAQEKERMEAEAATVRSTLGATAMERAREISRQILNS
ncbi:MAG TPA: ATP synthase F0 subunit B [Pyrinomonadaceae bacterium]|nr:ATP synthase F0 subunit B [Pyrinomonadaceae bacterium]